MEQNENNKMKTTNEVINAMHKTLEKLNEQLVESNTPMTPVNLTSVTMRCIDTKEHGFKVSGRASVNVRFYAETSV